MPAAASPQVRKPPAAAPARTRNRELTKARILDALRALIVEDGFRNVGISRVAQEAGVSKELIYRYFGGMEQMVLALLNDQEYWTRPGRWDDGAPAGRARGAAAASDADRMATMLCEQMRVLRGNDFVRQVRRWEIVDDTRLTAQVGQLREKASRAFLRRCTAPKDVDLPATAAILLAGALYLSLRAPTATSYFGVDLHSERGWARLEKAFAVLAQRVFAPLPGAAPSKRAQ